MPPEGLKQYGEQIISQRTDVWAIGVNIFMISYLKHPFQDPDDFLMRGKIREGMFLILKTQN